ncbi:MAG: acyl-CoA dehydrogenase family protein, partial [Persicimonas sp.]
PIINEIGTDEQKEEFLAPAIRGEKVAALGVSEPGAGSDVAGMTTVAKKDGDDYVISGQKTWITNGTRADFITLAARTDLDNRYGGISLFLFPTDTPGFEVGSKLEKIGNRTSDTAELFFDECRIPSRYLLGNEGHGFYYIMQNFQGERLVGALSAVAGAQLILDKTKEPHPSAPVPGPRDHTFCADLRDLLRSPSHRSDIRPADQLSAPRTRSARSPRQARRSRRLALRLPHR